MITRRVFEAILADDTKSIRGDLSWQPAEHQTSTKTFQAPIHSERGYPLKIVGRWNPRAGKLSYVLLHRGTGRIYALDMGVDHRNPAGERVGDTHKHAWTDQFRDKWAYVPTDITAPWNQPLAVWDQFCEEAGVIHAGILRNP